MATIWPRWFGAVAFLGPMAVGLLVTLLGTSHYSAAFEAGAFLPFGLAMLTVVVAMIRGRTLPSPAGPWSIDLNRRRWLWIPLFSILGLFAAGTAALDIADWFVPPTRVPVVIKFTSHSFRGGTDTIHTDQGSFRTPLLASFDPDPSAGPAIAIVGQFSGRLLALEEVPAR